MFLLPQSVRVYVATYPVNLRKSFDGLCNEVRCVLGHDPLSGHVYIFVNRRRTQVKLLVWTRGGFTIMHKRLEKGQFSFTKAVHSGATSVQIDVHELSMLLEGLEQKKGRSSARWNPRKSGSKHSEAAFSFN
jgi:transposase